MKPAETFGVQETPDFTFTSTFTFAVLVMKIRPVLARHKVGPDGRAPVWLRLADGRSTAYVATGVRVRPSEWNARTGRVRRSHPDADRLNLLIERLEQEAERLLLEARLEGRDLEPRTLKMLLKGEGEADADFFAFARAEVGALREKGQAFLAEKYEVTVRKFARFLGRDRLPFEELTPELLRAFEHYMRTVLGNRESTAHKSLAVLRALYNRAVRAGLVSRGTSPFQEWSPESKARHRPKERLTLEEVQRLEALELQGIDAVVRDAWCFAFYAVGMRWADVALLRWESLREDEGGWRLRYVQRKTGVPKDLRLPMPAVRILERYLHRRPAHERVFPILDGYRLDDPERERRALSSRCAYFNARLKRIAALAGITKPISFHTARHSAADALRRAGVSLYALSKGLGHSSLKITEAYLAALDAETVDREITGAFDGYVPGAREAIVHEKPAR